MEMESSRSRGRPRKLWMKTLEGEKKISFVNSGRKEQTFMEREDPWCEVANPDKPGYTMDVITNDNTVKPT
jgi:hypothetical protein